jgi:thiamine transporter
VFRYICHIFSGAPVWAGLSIPTEAALGYSLSYNATYMIPETVILVLATAYLASALDFGGGELRRLKSERADAVSYWLILSAGLVALAALVTDTVLVFSKLQNADSGEFAITALADVNWLAIAIITASAVLIAAVLIIVARLRESKK